MSLIASNSSMSSSSAPSSDSSFVQAPISNANNSTQLPPRYSAIAVASPIASAISAAGVAVNGLSSSASPPRYSSVFQSRSRPRADRTRARRSRLGLPIEQDRNAVPSASSGLHLREFHITTGAKSKPWTNLKIYGPSSTSGQKVLRFSGNDLVRGSLDLNLEMPQTINSINLSVCHLMSYLFCFVH